MSNTDSNRNEITRDWRLLSKNGSLIKLKYNKLKYGGLVKLVKMFAHQYSGEIASKSVKVK